MTARDHNNLLSIFYFIMGGLQLMAGLFIAVVYGLVGTVALSSGTREEDKVLGGVFLVMAIVVGVILLAISAFTIFTGFKVRKEQPIGRTLAIVISAISLLSFPLGTALGIYGLWFFLGEQGKNFYSGLSPASAYPPQPPPASSWQ